jgi:hypothetical protein
MFRLYSISIALGLTILLNACASQVAQVKQIQTALNWFLGLLSSGIYTPYTA